MQFQVSSKVLKKKAYFILTLISLATAFCQKFCWRLRTFFFFFTLVLDLLTHIFTTGFFLYPLKTKKPRLTNVFRGYRNRPGHEMNYNASEDLLDTNVVLFWFRSSRSEVFCKRNAKRCIQNPVEHQRWSFSWK